MAQVVGLFVYPVKSCHGVALAEAVCTEYGIEHDRTYGVVDLDTFEIMTQKQPMVGTDQGRLYHI